MALRHWNEYGTLLHLGKYSLPTPQPWQDTASDLASSKSPIPQVPTYLVLATALELIVHQSTCSRGPFLAPLHRCDNRETDVQASAAVSALDRPRRGGFATLASAGRVLPFGVAPDSKLSGHKP